MRRLTLLGRNRARCGLGSEGIHSLNEPREPAAGRSTELAAAIVARWADLVFAEKLFAVLNEADQDDDDRPDHTEKE